jgi:hypothetical protein
MARNYSIAALLTIMAIVAVALASIRNAMNMGPHGSDAAIAPVTGTIAGGIWGLGLAVWNRDHWGVPWMMAGLVAGMGLGLAAGAHVTVAHSWANVIAGPLLLVATAVGVAAWRYAAARRVPWDDALSDSPSQAPGAEPGPSVDCG